MFSSNLQYVKYNIFCPSGSVIVAFQMTLKLVNFYHKIFHDTTLKSWFKAWPASM